MLVGHAPQQFSDLIAHDSAYDALMERILWLADNPWDAWPVYPNGEPAFRETTFGEHGLISFRIDDAAELLVIFNILWIG
jgi:hypothetical protein